MTRANKRVRRCVVAAAAMLGVMAATASPAQALTPRQERFGWRLVNRVDVQGVNRHLIALQRIADQNGGNRAAGTSGYDASVAYVADKLEAARFDVDVQEFQFDYFELDDAEFEQLAPVPTTYELDEDFFVGDPSGVGEVSGPLVAVDVVLPPAPAPSSTSGCEAADFANFPVGAIALIQRGTCTFSEKVLNAEAAGAIAVVLFNEGQPGRTEAITPSTPDTTVPIVFTTFEIGSALAAAQGVEVRIDVEGLRETRTASNVIAETTSGRADNVVMAGAHLDSVPAGPGINDNGSGSAALLETALKLGSDPNVNNKVRFAWWGAEEAGLLGSANYVSTLGFEDQLDIALYLNFDMIGSPNAGFFVYDGDDSDAEGAGPGPFGAAQIEATFVNFLDEAWGIETEGTDFDARSDYDAFNDVGIPSGGLFTGAEGLKTPAQAAKWGGTAGVAYDPCYHQACDNLGNVDREALEANLEAMAWAVGIYAISTEDINYVTGRSSRAAARAAGAEVAAASTAAAAVVEVDGQAAA